MNTEITILVLYFRHQKVHNRSTVFKAPGAVHSPTTLPHRPAVYTVVKAQDSVQPAQLADFKLGAFVRLEHAWPTAAIKSKGSGNKDTIIAQFRAFALQIVQTGKHNLYCISLYG